jgi:hypothetical protein
LGEKAELAVSSLLSWVKVNKQTAAATSDVTAMLGKGETKRGLQKPASSVAIKTDIDATVASAERSLCHATGRYMTTEEYPRLSGSPGGHLKLLETL